MHNLPVDEAKLLTDEYTDCALIDSNNRKILLWDGIKEVKGTRKLLLQNGVPVNTTA